MILVTYCVRLNAQFWHQLFLFAQNAFGSIRANFYLCFWYGLSICQPLVWTTKQQLTQFTDDFIIISSWGVKTDLLIPLWLTRTYHFDIINSEWELSTCFLGAQISVKKAKPQARFRSINSRMLSVPLK